METRRALREMNEGEWVMGTLESFPPFLPSCVSIGKQYLDHRLILLNRSNRTEPGLKKERARERFLAIIILGLLRNCPVGAIDQDLCPLLPLISIDF